MKKKYFTPLLKLHSLSLLAFLSILAGWVVAPAEPPLVQAYLDPGSGSMLVYLLISLVATFIYTLKNSFFTLKNRALSFFAKDKVNLRAKKNLVFYSEGGHYWPTFKPVIEELTKQGIPCAYYTSDQKDPGLDFQAENIALSGVSEGKETQFDPNQEFSPRFSLRAGFSACKRHS